MWLGLLLPVHVLYYTSPWRICQCKFWHYCVQSLMCIFVQFATKLILVVESVHRQPSFAYMVQNNRPFRWPVKGIRMGDHVQVMSIDLSARQQFSTMPCDGSLDDFRRDVKRVGNFDIRLSADIAQNNARFLIFWQEALRHSPPSRMFITSSPSR